MKTPTLERHAACATTWREIIEFFEWLEQRETPLHLAYYEHSEPPWDPPHRHFNGRLHDLLAEYFGIDQAQLEKERRALLHRAKESQKA